MTGKGIEEIDAELSYLETQVLPAQRQKLEQARAAVQVAEQQLKGLGWDGKADIDAWLKALRDKYDTLRADAEAKLTSAKAAIDAIANTE